MKKLLKLLPLFLLCGMVAISCSDDSSDEEEQLNFRVGASQVDLTQGSLEFVDSLQNSDGETLYQYQMTMLSSGYVSSRYVDADLYGTITTPETLGAVRFVIYSDSLGGLPDGEYNLSSEVKNNAYTSESYMHMMYNLSDYETSVIDGTNYAMPKMGNSIMGHPSSACRIEKAGGVYRVSFAETQNVTKCSLSDPSGTEYTDTESIYLSCDITLTLEGLGLD